MWRVASLLVAVHLVAAFSIQGATAPPSPEHLVRIAEAFSLVEKLGPSIWPGISAADSPVLFIEGESEYLLNSESPSEGFDPLTSLRFRGRPVFSRSRTLPPGLEASFPAIGRETVVIGTPEATGRTPANWILIVAHELFHVDQAAHGLHAKVNALEIASDQSGMWQLTFPFPYEDERVSRAMHIAGHELYRILESDSDRDYRAMVAAEALRNLATVLQLAFPDQKNGSYLKFVTTKEGSARYFEYRLAEEAARRYRPSAELARLDGADAFEEVWKSRYVNYPGQIKHLGRVSRSRQEFYNLGLGLGLVLDELDPEWKTEFHNPDVWLDDIFVSRAGQVADE